MDRDIVEMNAKLIDHLRDVNKSLLVALKAVHCQRIAWPAQIEHLVVAAIAKARGEGK